VIKVKLSSAQDALLLRQVTVRASDEIIFRSVLIIFRGWPKPVLLCRTVLLASAHASLDLLCSPVHLRAFAALRLWEFYIQWRA